MARKRVAVMQPYFFPYARYFRLLADVDEFVIYDCVQFTRESSSARIHRTQVPGPSGAIEWLTLPLAKKPLETLISDLAFSADAREVFDKRLERLDWVAGAREPAADRIRTFLYSRLDSVVDYLESGLRLVADLLGIDVRFSRCSRLDLDSSLRGQQHVIAAVKAVGGTHYLNLPGGRPLYDEGTFTEEGIELSFLPSYEGPHFYMLHSLMTQPAELIAQQL